ncbi:hypothetical protein [Neobacillus sp. SuZ13]|uniref:hypothetical protein n=1 Tax=Neobacillus sp. SuZ13 TaxID=3047875 RepID=UPI0024BFE241|nr:hypothetical protein [Neobacillus sp. SuZ13]WHY65298.1 hypothetical protein QNH17_19685 [Neobacillus sp. SuZ13]
MVKKVDTRSYRTRNNIKETVINNTKTVSGDSVDELRNLEEANTLISGDEIQQQNENL